VALYTSRCEARPRVARAAEFRGRLEARGASPESRSKALFSGPRRDFGKLAMAPIQRSAA